MSGDMTSDGRGNPPPPVRLVPTPPPGLTPQRLEIVRLSACGLTVKEMAERLRLSPDTVKSHLGYAYQATNTRNRAHLVATCMSNGWIPAKRLRREGD